MINSCIYSQSYTSYFTGDTTDINSSADYGICLMGGSTEDDRAMIWFLEKANGGDIIVLRASGSDGYNDYFYSELGVEVNSVETIVFNNAIAVSDSYVLQQIANAEAIWIAGGDQSVYIDYWKNTEVQNLLNAHINEKKGVLGGTSAGMAILGSSYFSALNGTVFSSEALEDPYNSFMTIGQNDFIEIPILENTITDTHFSERNREGRIFTFIARMNEESETRSFGIACDEYTAVCIDSSGLGFVFGEWPVYDDNAFFIQMNCENDNQPEQMQIGLPLTWNYNGQAALVYKVGGTSTGNHYLDLNNWQSGNGGEWLYWYADNGDFFEEDGNNPNCDDLILEKTNDHSSKLKLIKRIDYFGRNITQNYKGLIIDIYEDFSTIKRIQF